jgi:hypothetical protein
VLVAPRVAAPVATATSAATASATTATATAKSTPATAAATSRAIFAGTRFIHGQGASIDGLAIEFVDSLRGLLVGGHCDKGESAGFAREFILDQHDFLNGARSGEKILKIRFGCVEGQISYV